MDSLPRNLSDSQLEQRLRSLAWGEKQVLVSFLRHLSEFEDRRLHEAASYPSLFQYCVRKLHLAESEAYLRILCARRSREFPQILDLIGRGELQLSGIAKISAVLTPDNAEMMLSRIAGKSAREIERIAAESGTTGAPSRDIVKFLPPAINPALSRQEPPILPMTSELVPTGHESSAPAPSGDMLAAPLEAEPTKRPLVRISFTASESLILDIERARSFLRHKFHEGRIEDIFREALAMLLAKADPLRRKPGRQPKSIPQTKRSRRIPSRVKAEVWRRDAGQCAFRSAGGDRCASREWLEYDHIQPYALGGASNDPDNVRLLCRSHNQHVARRMFGRKS